MFNFAVNPIIDCMKNIFLTACLLLCCAINAQVQLLHPVQPSVITVCGPAMSLRDSIINPIGNANLTGCQITIDLPTGIEYVPNSFQARVGTTSVSALSTSNIPVFTINGTFISGSSVSYTYQVKATCATTNTGVQRNNTLFQSNTQANIIDNSNTYTIRRPELAITYISNRSFLGNVGQTMQRCISIKNTGNAPLSTITLYDQHDGNITINSVDRGTITNTSSGSYEIDTIRLSSSNFRNGSLLLPNDSVIVCESITINFCGNANSSIGAYWGCNRCQTVTDNAAISVVSFNNPRLSVAAANNVPTCYPSTATQALAIWNNGSAAANNIVIPFATNILASFIDTTTIQVRHGNRNSVANVPYKIRDLRGYSVSADPDASMVLPPSVAAHYVTRPFYETFLLYPQYSIPVGDTLWITFNVVTACVGKANDLCGNGAYQFLFRWRNSHDAMNGLILAAGASPIGGSTDILYFNDCQQGFVMPGVKEYSNSYDLHIPNTSSQNSPTMHLLSLVADSVPNSADVGPGRVSFTSTVYGWSTDNLLVNKLPAGVKPYMAFEITFPNCIQVDNFYIKGSNGVRWDAISSAPSAGGRTYRFELNEDPNDYYKYNPPFSLQGAKFYVDYTMAVCSNCATTQNLIITVTPLYVNDPSCACAQHTGCVGTVSIPVACPQQCAGVSRQSFTFKRISLGKPDNDNNGIIDAAGSININAIRLDRAVYGDTIQGTYRGAVGTNATNPSWQNMWARMYIPYGANAPGCTDLTYIGGTIRVKRGGATFTATVSATQLLDSVVDIGVTRRYKWNIGINKLNTLTWNVGNFSTTITSFLADDEVIFVPNFLIRRNTQTTIASMNITSQQYTTDNSSTRYSCNNFNANMTVYGYSTNSSGTGRSIDYNNNSFSGCVVTDTIWRRVDPFIGEVSPFTNYFPYEHRTFQRLETMDIHIPTGYQVVSVSLRQQTAGNNSATSYSNSYINYQIPVPAGNYSTTFSSVTNDYVLSVNVSNLYSRTGGGTTVPYSDESGFQQVLVAIRPTCEVVEGVNATARNDKWVLNWDNTIQEINSNGGNGMGEKSVDTFRAYGTQQYLIYKAPNFTFTSPNPTINEDDGQLCWQINITNNSNIHSRQAFLRIPTNPNFSITSIKEITYDPGFPFLLSYTGGIYTYGDLDRAMILEVCATYTGGCNMDSIRLYLLDGMCSMPTSLTDYENNCKTFDPNNHKNSILLQINPQKPNLNIDIIKPPVDTVLCKPVVYTIVGRNSQLGVAQQLQLDVVIPQGMTLTGNTILTYPVTAPPVTVSPAFLSINPADSSSNYRIDLDNLNSNPISSRGLRGVNNPDSAEFRLQIELIPTCDYVYGGLLGGTLRGNSFCRLADSTSNFVVTKHGLDSNSIKYATQITLQAINAITPCSDTSELVVSIRNLGPDLIGNKDSIVIQLPVGLNYVPSSMASILNITNSEPNIYAQGGGFILKWAIPPGIVMNDTVKFGIKYIGNPSVLTCGNLSLKATSEITKIATCASSTCDISIPTGTASITVPIQKGTLNVSNVVANATRLPSGEQINLDFNYTNTNTSIKNHTTIFSYYADADKSGTYSVGDNLIQKDSITTDILTNVPYTHTTSFIVPGGKACQLLLIVDSVLNPCVCTKQTIVITPVFDTYTIDTTVCPTTTLTLGTITTTGHTYAWIPTTDLDNPASATPVYTIPANLTFLPQLHTYYLNIDRGNGCISKDTFLVTVKPTPIVNTLSNITVCSEKTIPTISISTTPATAVFTWVNTNTSIGINAAGDSSILSYIAPINQTGNNIVGTITITPTLDGCIGADSTVIVTIASAPTPIIVQNYVVCTKDTARILPAITPTTLPTTIINYTNSNTAIGLPANGSANIPNFLAVNNGSSDIIGTIKYIQTLNMCKGDTAEFTITIKPIPVFTPIANVVACGRDNIGPFLLQSSLGGSIRWNNDNTAIGLGTTDTTDIPAWIAPINSTATNIVAKITANAISNGCSSDTLKFSITLKPTPQLTIPSAIEVCEGDAISPQSFAATPAGATVNWVNNNTLIGLNAVGSGDIVSYTSPNVTADEAGTIIAIPSLNGCSDTAKQFTITTRVVPTINSHSDIYVCSQDSIRVGNWVYLPANAPVTATWTNSNNGIGIASSGNGNIANWIAPSNTSTVDIVGTIIVTIANSNKPSCMDTMHFTVHIRPTPVIVNSTPDIIACEGNIINIAPWVTSPANGVVVNWTSNNASIGINTTGTGDIATFNAANVTASQIATIQAIPSLLNCQGSTVSFSIKVNPTTTSTRTVYICPTESYFVGGNNQTAPGIYKDTTTNHYGCDSIITTTLIINPTSATNRAIFICANQNFYVEGANLTTSGTYHDTLTNRYGCDSVITTVLTVWPLPTPDLGADVFICADNTAVLSPGGNFSVYRWQDAANQAVYNIDSNSNNGLYWVEVTDANGCKNKDSVLVTIYPLPKNFLPKDINICFGDRTPIQVLNYVGYQWSTGEIINTIFPQDTGKYWLTVTDENSCNGTDTIFVTGDCPIILYIPNSFSPNGDNLNDIFLPVDYGNIVETYDLKIWDRWDELLFQSSDINLGWDGKYKNSTVDLGVYTYHMEVTYRVKGILNTKSITGALKAIR